MTGRKKIKRKLEHFFSKTCGKNTESVGRRFEFFSDVFGRHCKYFKHFSACHVCSFVDHTFYFSSFYRSVPVVEQSCVLLCGGRRRLQYVTPRGPR